MTVLIFELPKSKTLRSLFFHARILDSATCPASITLVSYFVYTVAFFCLISLFPSLPFPPALLALLTQNIVSLRCATGCLIHLCITVLPQAYITPQTVIQLFLLLLLLRTLKVYFLSNIQVYNKALLAKITIHQYISSTYRCQSFNWKFVPFDQLFEYHSTFCLLTLTCFRFCI